MASSIKSKKVMIWAGFISVLMMVCVTVFAADPNDPNAVNIVDQKQDVVTKVTAVDEKQAPAKEVTLKKEILTTIEQRMQKRISVDFRNTPIEDVIRIMAEQVGVDIIKSPNVTGNVTATLTNIPLQEALDNILATHGYGYVASENMIRIAPAAELAEKSEKLVSKIYLITYADVTEVEKSLKTFMSARGTISANPGTSNIIVTDSESKIKAIETFIEQVDRMTPQILVEARIYDITSTDRFDLGINWDVGRNTTFDADTH
ncbi:MAG: secretin and TonB N-terminal domain-containing protein, partial [Planctomycetota bacterium]|nr:secretin and TonB N-terminal domain-containing protein [Planctomycetota bacterium]